MIAPPSLLIRADASAEIGTGHVMRCLALAQAWQAAVGQATFAVCYCPDALEARLRDEGFGVERVSATPGTDADAAETTAFAAQSGAEWVVVDGYRFGAGYQEALRAAALQVLFLDDYGHAERYMADLVLNQNVYASAAIYAERAAHTRLLLGLDYLLLRREFWAWQTWERPAVACARRILVTLGGGDADNVTGRVLDALGQIGAADLEAVVLVGASSPHAAAVRAQADADDRLTVRHNVTDMPELMAWAEVAVTAGGSTCYEAARLGLPCLALVLAENQHPVADALAARGVVQNLGPHDAVGASEIAAALDSLMADADRRARMTEAGQALVPGGGPQRVVGAIADASIPGEHSQS